MGCYRDRLPASPRIPSSRRAFYVAAFHSCKYRRLHARATIAICNSRSPVSGDLVAFWAALSIQIPSQFDLKAAHYLELLGGAGMLTGLQKYAGKAVRQRGSSPKLQALNTALMTAQSGLSHDEARTDREFRGRLVESAVGATSPMLPQAASASCSTGVSAARRWTSWCVSVAR